MRTLHQSLQDQDSGFLQILGELWGLDVPSRDKDSAIDTMCTHILAEENLIEVIEALPTSSQQALAQLLHEGGQLPSGDFTQKYGDLRSMGPGRRDREKPWRSPSSDTEKLHYLGLISRAFADSPAGPKEFIFIPTNLRQKIAPILEPIEPSSQQRGEVSPPGEIQPATSALLDDATTLAAALRQQPAISGTLSRDRIQKLTTFMLQPKSLHLLLHLLVELGYLSQSPLQPVPSTIASLLETPRKVALHELTTTWQHSDSWNDFKLLGHLEPASGEWPQHPEAVRAAALSLLEPIPRGQWQDLIGFLLVVKDQHPTFARPGGDFDSWFLRDRRTGNFLRGIEAWEAVDGALLRALITGPLHWLGAIDLGSSGADDHPDRFRLTPWAQVLFESNSVPELPEPISKAQVDPNGKLIIPREVPRSIRYQIARLCTWEAFENDQYHYRLKPSAVLAAADQGLQSQHVQRLLTEVVDPPIPPTLITAVNRLMNQGLEARLESLVLLRVKDSDLLDQLMENKKTSRWIKERLGSTSAIVAKNSLQQLIEQAARNGLLIEPPEEGLGALT